MSLAFGIARSAGRRRPWRLAIGGTLVALLGGLSLLALAWTPAEPTRLAIASRLRAPLESGLLGTDHLGRDVLSLLMAGGWNSLSVAVVSVAVGGSLGTLLGAAAAARRGWFEAVAMRACDVAFAFPPIVSAMMLGAALGTGRTTAIVAIAAFMVPVFARVARASAAQIWARDYVLAARGAGKGAARITIEHVLPNIAGVLIVQATIQLGLAILTEAGLSFLGLGAPPPTPSWGRMLADAQTYLVQAPWLAVAPGATIALAVLGTNLLGEGLRDRLDPRRDIA